MAHEYVYWNGDHTDGGYTTDNGIGPRMNDWNKGAGNRHDEHVCRPVIVDAQGRKRTIVCFDSGSNTQTYVTKTETIVERFHVPAVTEYKYSYPVRVEEYKHSYPVRVEEFKPSSPANRWGRPSSPVHDRPPKVEEIITKIQTEVSEVPTRPGPLTAMNWRQPRNPPKAPNGTGGYGEYSDYSKDDYWNRPSGNVINRSDSFDDDDDSYRRNDGTKEPIITNSNGWGRPKHAEWATVPNYTQTIDSKEAERRYGFNATSRPTINSEEAERRYGFNATSRPTINSEEAKEKYKGAKVPTGEAGRRYGNLNTTSRPYSTGEKTIDSKVARQKYQGVTV